MSMETNKKGLKTKQNAEFRYYEVPTDIYVTALLGERWILNYGTEALHFHNYLEIGYCYYGEGKMIFGNQQCDYRGRMFTVISRNYPHCTRSEPQKLSRWEYLYIDVSGFLKRAYRDKPVLAKKMTERIENHASISQAEEYPEIAGLIQNILEEMRTQKEFYKESVRGYVHALLVKLAREGGGQDKVEPVGEKEERIVKILEYIAAHYPEEIRVPDLAAMCHTSETHFRRIFEKTMNITPMEYINMIRIQNACTLLSETSESIETIRQKVGFSTASTFNRNFKRIVKMSPGQWRQQKEVRLADFKVSVYKGW